jgi:23S rRNA (cytosine1962-C5)-methyltransferase
MNEILVTEKTEGYELLDSGEGQKLERFGERVLSRPDPQAIWRKKLSEEKWNEAYSTYTREGETGKWTGKGQTLEEFQIKFEDFVFNLKLTPAKHVGLFPEQSGNWKWLENKIKKTDRPISVLNLFAHTGGATLACAKAGAEVCHVDASKYPVDHAHRNLDDSGMADKKVRFIVDDVRKFVEREIKRGVKYDVIVMDPPVYGKGTNDKVWRIEEDLVPFLERVSEVLSNEPLAILINGYASIYSPITYKNILESITQKFGGNTSSGELAIKESEGERMLPAGIFARWEK